MNANDVKLNRPEGKMHDYFTGERERLGSLNLGSATPRVVEMVSRMEKNSDPEAVYIGTDGGFGATIGICEMILEGDQVKLVQMIHKMSELENKIYAYQVVLAGYRRKAAFLGAVADPSMVGVESCIDSMNRAILIEEHALTELEVAFMREVFEWDNSIIAAGDERGIELVYERDMAGDSYYPLGDYFKYRCRPTLPEAE